MGVVGTSMNANGVYGESINGQVDTAAGRFVAGPLSQGDAVSAVQEGVKDGAAAGRFLVTSTSAGMDNYALYAETRSLWGTGLYATAPLSAVVGVTTSAADTWMYGVYGDASSSSGRGHGVYGKGPDTGYGVYSEGNAHVEGDLTWTPVKRAIALGPRHFGNIFNAEYVEITDFEIAPHMDCPLPNQWKTAYIAPLDVPDGTRITKITYYFKDNSATLDTELELRKTDLRGGLHGGNQCFEHREAGRTYVGLDRAGSITVDNSTGALLVRLIVGCDIWVYGVVVEYETTGP